MGIDRLSICANSPLGGPATNPESSAIDVDRYVPGQKAAMAEVRWPNGSTVKVGFLNRTDEYGELLRKKVCEIAPTWSRYANITFAFVEGATRNITINFSGDAAPLGTYSSQLGVESALYSGAGKRRCTWCLPTTIPTTTTTSSTGSSFTSSATPLG